MPAYLIEHPPTQRQFKERGITPSGVIVVHTAENTPDWVGADAGAEAVARFIQSRTDFGSYHLLCDSDSIILLVPLHLQAYGDGTGSNPHAIHVSGATQAAKWGQAPTAWREETARNMGAAAARAARWLKSELGIVVPARRISRPESDQRKPGFISHAERDPTRRSDPGQAFPWPLFLGAFSDALDPAAPTPNITDALHADTIEERRAALRRILRRGDEKAAAAAQRWLEATTAHERASAKARRARETLRSLQVEP